ncbi:MAG: hypothetical protein VXZ43_03955 [Pseudomonadota bacterium]|jgi:hypothetical protein|uniref:DUF7662 domain-containing protein n=1 Tax=Brevundimonas aurantiaca TaxID=74316 RepID=UPI001D1807B6|nr:hypothetical protein [Brevundimonas aurantiaca]MCC4295564.1 hypothetical protein [Brevundimonas aurantiaca]MEC8456045.1 hypothetical protein [Pseudomonadota bacterium]
MSVYAPLEYRLAQTKQNALTLSFEEIEALLGRKLPQSAYDERIRRQWWANTDTHVQAKAWLKAGRKAKLNPARNEVTFVKEQTETGVDGALLSLAALTPAARSLVERTCQERGVDLGTAVALLLNETARSRNEAFLDRMDRSRSRSTYSSVSSVDLIREDRDGR